MFSSRFMLFPTLQKKKFWCKKKLGGGGGVDSFFLISRFMFYAIFNIKKNNIEKCPFTYWLNARWFLQIVDRDSWNLYSIISSIPLF